MTAETTTEFAVPKPEPIIGDIQAHEVYARFMRLPKDPTATIWEPSELDRQEFERLTREKGTPQE